MKKSLALLMGFILLVSCSGAPVSTTTSVAMVLVADAGTQLDRHGRQLTRAWAGTLLMPDDVLVPVGTVTVLCPGPQVVVINERVRPCPETAEPLNRDRMRFDTISRGDVPPSDAPYILTPRASLVLNQRPLLVWNANDRATYDLELRVGAEVIWTLSDVTGPEINYPADADPLEVQRLYTLIVTNRQTGQRSDDGPVLATDFRLASPQLRAVIDNTLSKVDQPLTNLASPVRDLVAAEVLLSFEEDDLRPYAEAATLLVPVAMQLDTPPIWNRLGTVQLLMNLPIEAGLSFDRALAAAQRGDDPLEQAHAYAGRWRTFGQNDDYNAALNIFEQLGANDLAESLRAERSGNPAMP